MADTDRTTHTDLMQALRDPNNCWQDRPGVVMDSGIVVSRQTPNLSYTRRVEFVLDGTFFHMKLQRSHDRDRSMLQVAVWSERHNVWSPFTEIPPDIWWERLPGPDRIQSPDAERRTRFTVHLVMDYVESIQKQDAYLT